MIELKNIDVTFQNGSHEFKAVDNVSLKINKGEIFGIVGPSGAGKSTLVRVINLLQRPTNGEVIIEGSDITKFNRKQLRKTRLNIGMIFQHFNLISGSTIAENVAFSLYANNYPKDKIKELRLQEHWRTIQISCYAMKQPLHWILRIQKKSWNYYERSMKKHISRSYLSHMRWM